jgi:hypothetical protein
MQTPLLSRVALTVVLAGSLGARAAVSAGPNEQSAAAGGPVTIDFRALGDDGTPVLDLKASDLALKINGRVKEVRSLELVRLDGAPGAASAATQPFATNAASEPGRDVLLAIDDESISPGKEALLRESVTQLLAGLSGRDRVGLLSMRPGGANLGFTASQGAVGSVVTAMVGGAPGTEAADNFLCRSRRVLDSLQSVLAATTAERFEVVVFLSASMSGPVSERRSTLGAGSGDLCQLTTSNFQQFTAAANAARAALHVVHLVEAQGSVKDSQGAATDPQSMVAGLEAVAAAAGTAVIRPIGNSKTALARVLRETSAYYLAGFEPDSSERNGSNLRVDLKVARDRVKVRVRPDIALARTDAKAAAKPNPRDMLRVATTYRDLPVRATAMSAQNPGSGDVKVVAIFEPVDPSTKLVSASVALFDEKSTLKKQWSAQDADLARRPVMAALTTAPGKYRMRVATVDTAGRGGTVDYDLNAGLTPAEPLKLSTMSLGTTAGGSFAPKLVFSDDPAALGYLEIYGVPKGAVVAVKYELATTDDGAPIGTGDAVVRPGATEDARSAFGGFPLNTLEPGDYVMRAIVLLDGKPVGRTMRTLRKVKP